MRVVLTDGGRFKAGFKGLANDCVCRAIAIVKAEPYEKIYSEINSICRELGYKGLTARKGLPKDVMFGFPVTTENGEYKIVEGLSIDEFSQTCINKTLKELQDEQAGVAHLL